MAKAALICRWTLLALSAWTLGSCGDAAPRAKAAAESGPAFNAAEFRKLASRVSQLELQRAQTDHSTVFLKPADRSFHHITASMGGLAVSVADVSEYANGSRVFLNLGNPLNAVFQGGTARVQWGRADQGGNPTGQTFSQEATFADDLPAGSWRKVELDLPDVPPSDLGYIRISDLKFRSIALTASN